MSSEKQVGSHKHEETEKISGSMLWELFITIRPIFYQSFQQNVAEVYTHCTECQVATTCRGIKRMFFRLPKRSLDHRILDDSGFSRSLYSLLEILENLAPISFAQGHSIQRTDCTSFAEPKVVTIMPTMIYMICR
jgi:hypothetical protein